jgi:hypothetical protein
MNALSEYLLEHPYGQDGFAGDLENYATLLGGEVDGDRILCPSPGKGKDDRSCCIHINRDGRPFIYDVEGPIKDAYAFVHQRLKLAPRAVHDYTRAALDIWSEALPATGTLVERYLRSRALTLPVPPCLHFHPSLRYSRDQGSWPVMVAERADVEGRVFAIHRTFLNPTGQVRPIA